MLNTIKRETVGQVIVIGIEIQSLDVTNVRQITRCVTDIMLDGGRIIVDLGTLRYFDVGGFAAILKWTAGGPRNADVRLCSGSANVQALFELLRAPTVVQLYGNREEALASFDHSLRRGTDARTPAGKRDRPLAGRRIA